MKKLSALLILIVLISCKKKEPALKWDFSEKSVYNYSFVQKIKTTNKISPTDLKPAKKGEIIGDLIVSSQTNGLGDLMIKNLQMFDTYFDANGNDIKGPGNPIPYKLINNMSENGVFVDGAPDILFNTIFPLPSAELTEGESEKLKLEMPLNTGDLSATSSGFNTITFTGFENWNGRKCAVLKGNLKIDELPLPEGTEGEYTYNNIGEATYYFDMKNRVYVGSSVNMKITLYANNLNEQGEGTYLDVVTENNIEVKLKEVKEL